MKNKFLLAVLIITTLISCDSSSDSITPIVVPDTFNHLFIKTENSGNFPFNAWGLHEEFGTNPVGLRRSDTFTQTPLIYQGIISQSSAYSKIAIAGSNKYVVYTGDKVVVYNVSTAITPVPTQFPILDVEAMEFVNGRFFMVVNHVLREYDLATMNPIVSFSPITLLSPAKSSNMTFDGDFLYVISNGKYYKIDTLGSGSIVAGFPKNVTLARYEGLEYVNNPNPASPCNNALYAIREDSFSKQLIKLDADTGLESVILDISNGVFVSNGSRISSVLDYETEYYYVYSLDLYSGASSTLTIIDLTPSSGVVSVNSVNSIPGYYFGSQLKD